MDEMNNTEFNAEPNTEKTPRYSEAIVSRAPLRKGLPRSC